MVLTVNGERTECEATNVRALLDTLGHEPDAAFVAVAINHAVVPRARWTEAVLKDGDAVEIISPRQGG